MYLTSRDFTVNDGQLVKINDQGYSFVFIYTNSCKWCHDLMPAFKRLSTIVRGVNFQYMDMANDNYILMDMSAMTNTPIEYVPFLILFLNGKQIAHFSPDDNNPNIIEQMESFIVSNTRRQPNGNSSFEVESDIPPYSLGIPYNRGTRKVCKLFNDAYGN